jgi:hypothetical protein
VLGAPRGQRLEIDTIPFRLRCPATDLSRHLYRHQAGRPYTGLITLIILKITWDSWRVISHTNPGEAPDAVHHDQ